MQACFLGDRMACRIGLLVAFLAVSLASFASEAQPGAEVSGIWLTQAGDAKVRVSNCGGGIFGGVFWLEKPTHPPTRKLQNDDKKTNPLFAKRPINCLPPFICIGPPRPEKKCRPDFKTP